MANLNPDVLEDIQEFWLEHGDITPSVSAGTTTPRSLVGGENVTVTVDDVTGAVTIDVEATGTGTDLTTATTDDLSEGSTNLYFSDARVQAVLDVGGYLDALPDHDHVWADIDAETVPDFALTAHDHDTRYYTQTQIDVALQAKSDVGHVHAYGDITGTPDLSGYLTSVSWADVANKPTTFTPEAHGHDYSEILNTPDLTQYLTSVSWTDITNKPATFPADPHNHDGRYYTETELDALLSAKADNVDVFSGDYNDLINTPDLTQYLTSVSWTDVSNKPTEFTPEAHTHPYAEITGTPDLSQYLTSVSWVDVEGKPVFAAVATTGSYTDLSDTPTIPTVPTNVSAFANDVGYITDYVVTEQDVTQYEGAITIQAAQIVGLDLSTDDLTEGSANLFFTDERVDDRVATLVTAGQNITVDYNDTTGELTVSASGGSNFSGSYTDLDDIPATFTPEAHTHPWSEVTNKPTTFTPEAHNHDDRYYTETEVDGFLSGKADTADIFSGDYTDLTNKPDLSQYLTSVAWTDVANKPTVFPPDTHTHAYGDIEGTPDLSGYLTQEQIEDNLSTFIIAGDNLDATYDDVAGTLTLDYVGGSSGYDSSSFDADFNTKTTDDLSEGTTNLFFTEARAQDAVGPIPSDLSDLSDSTNLLDVTWTDVSGKPTFASVATSGSYDDLSNTPTIPTVPDALSAFTNDVGYITGVAWGEVADKPATFPPEAHSHAYSELTDTPTIPTAVSELSNDSGYITGLSLSGVSDVTLTTPGAGNVLRYNGTGWVNGSVDWTEVTSRPALHAVATSGDYTDLTNTPTIPSDVSDLADATGLLDITWSEVTDAPTIPTAVSELTNDEGYISSVAWNDVTGKPTFHAVSTSGDYNDLSNTPLLATVAISGSYDDLSNKPSIPTARTDEEIEDVVGTLLTDGANTTVTYDDVNGTLTIDATVPTDLSDLTDSTNLLDVDWTDVTTKPATATRWPSWTEVTSKPSTFTPEAHTHPHTEVTGLGDVVTRNVHTASAAPTDVEGVDGDLWIDTSAVVTAGGGASVLDDLTDVDLTTTAPTDGQFLHWNDSLQVWEATDAPSGGGGSTFGWNSDEATNTVTGTWASAGGADSTASGNYSFAYGDGANATKTGAVSLGPNSYAVGTNAISLGHNAMSYETSAIMIGNGQNRDADTVKFGVDQGSSSRALKGVRKYISGGSAGVYETITPIPLAKTTRVKGTVSTRYSSSSQDVALLNVWDIDMVIDGASFATLTGGDIFYNNNTLIVDNTPDITLSFYTAESFGVWYLHVECNIANDLAGPINFGGMFEVDEIYS